jgi:phosphate starvation-inducible PhoH-like protein
MNIYRVFMLFSFFCIANTFKTIKNNNNNNKVTFSLFLKKQKATSFNLYTPKTINQEKYLNYLNNDTAKIIISTGPAGTGKTLLACQKAITDMKSQEIDKIIITRPVVTIEEDIGFLPGNIIKKMDPWTKPIFDIFLEYYSKSELDLFLNNGKIEICPLVFMRGRTFKNAFIIADEMQNSSPNQMKMLVTRLGINSRMVITGDLNQTDIIKENGLYDFVNKVENHNNTELIKIVKFENKDIERSEIVKKVIEIYSYKRTNNIEINKKQINETVIIKELKNDTQIIVSKVSSTKNVSLKPVNSKFTPNDNDAALIPRHHMTKSMPHITYNHDIFFEPRDF